LNFETHLHYEKGDPRHLLFLEKAKWRRVYIFNHKGYPKNMISQKTKDKK
jgi:hypothetical protein